MRSSRVTQVLKLLVGINRPAFIWGAPGVGKSAIVRALGAELERPVVDIRAPLLDPTDLRGIPMLHDGRAVWCPPAFLPSAGDKPGILFFDELNAAPPLVQASLYQLTLDRRVGEYRLPDGWSIVAAGNRLEDRALAFRMPSALSNRFVHVEVEVDYDDWRAWAHRAQIHPLVVGLLALRRELLHDMRSGERGFATPRSWAMASDVLKQFGSVDLCFDVLVGTVGEGAATELRAFAERTQSGRIVELILDDPEHAELPSDLGDLYAVVSFLITSIKDPRSRAACGTLLGRLPVEMAILVARDTLRVDPSLRKQPQYTAFISLHSSSINAHD